MPLKKLGPTLRLIRLDQWIKNCFVFTGLIFGKEYDNFHIFLIVCLVAFAFSLVSSSVYVANDIIDRENDRHHPKKRFRPVASGELSVNYAIGLSIFLGIAGLSIGLYTGWKVVVILLAYLILNALYTWKLKHIVIVDVFCISAGFMLRILAGTRGVDIPPSNWLLLCGLMITLFLGFAKRRAELITLKGHEEEHRAVLNQYSASFLDEVISICATGAIITYSLYTMSDQTIMMHRSGNLIYTVPFVIYALFRYIYLVQKKQSGGDPTRDLLRDPHIILAVLGWVVMTVILLYRGSLHLTWPPIL